MFVDHQEKARLARNAPEALWNDVTRWSRDVFADRDVDYDSDFGYRLARTPEDDHAAWRLRYRVYCEETGYLPKDEHLSGYEFDASDAHAKQGLLIHRASGLLAGTSRLILPKKDVPFLGLPALEQSAALRNLLGKDLPVETTGEISRFLIDPLFRRRASDGLYPQQQGLNWAHYDPRLAMPKLILGLMIAIIDLAMTHNVTHISAVIDPPLLRLLRRVGMIMVMVGEPIEFHGLRQPVYIETTQALASVHARFPAAASHLL